jgi:hypothetical protein
MRLGIRMLNNPTINNLIYLNQIQVIAGETASIYFQFVDLDTVNQKDLLGNRYMPAVGAYAYVYIGSNNDANVIQKVAFQPFSQDASIWQFNLSTTDTEAIGCINLDVTLIEGASVKKAQGMNVLIAIAANSSCC